MYFGDGSLEFQFFLAEKLGKTLSEIQELPNAEFVQWSVYFAVKAGRIHNANFVAAKVGR